MDALYLAINVTDPDTIAEPITSLSARLRLDDLSYGDLNFMTTPDDIEDALLQLHPLVTEATNLVLYDAQYYLGFISNAAARLQLKSDHNPRRVNYTHTSYFPKTLNETPTKNPNS
ncbi:MAG: hypothetical protein OTI34_08825 [Lewinella sp.]|nr:hypothetical protein [Lewinella sp.]